MGRCRSYGAKLVSRDIGRYKDSAPTALQQTNNVFKLCWTSSRHRSKLKPINHAQRERRSSI